MTASVLRFPTTRSPSVLIETGLQPCGRRLFFSSYVDEQGGTLVLHSGTNYAEAMLAAQEFAAAGLRVRDMTAGAR
jgi:hypothetical protein